MTKRLPHGEVTLQEIAAAYPALALVAGQTLRLPALDPETAEWIDGPVFVKWLHAHGLEGEEEVEGVSGRRLREWRHGMAIPLATVDRVLTRMGYSLHDLPATIWVRPPARATTTPVDEATKAQCVERYRNGESTATIATSVGVDPRSIRNWASRRAAA